MLAVRIRQIAFVLLAVLAWPAYAEDEPEPERTICEPVLVDSGIEAYGTLITFKPGQLMILSDFRLRADPASPGSRDFTVWKGRNQDLQGLSWPRGANPDKPLEFAVGGKAFLLELDRSILQFRPLAHNELVVWPKAEYLAQRARTRRAD